MLIKEMKEAVQNELDLVVINATPRETKAKKPYLVLELFDGFDKISANYWDWAGKSIPPKDTILTVQATKGEYMGTPQLTIKHMKVASNRSLWDFAPQPTVNIDHYFEKANCLIKSMRDPDLVKLCTVIFEQLKSQWLHVPGANTIHHAYKAGTLIHSVTVAQIAAGMCTFIEGSNVDLCIAGGLLHDLGKLFTYQMSGIAIEMTDEGMLFDHIFLGANFISNFADHYLDTDNEKVNAKLEMLIHIILSHHGVKEYGSPVTPASLEAHIVCHADGIDASAEQIRDASKKKDKVKWTDKIWGCGNKPHLAIQYVEAVMRTYDLEEVQKKIEEAGQPQN